jgi:hypothetical protein
LKTTNPDRTQQFNLDKNLMQNGHKFPCPTIQLTLTSPNKNFSDNTTIESHNIQNNSTIIIFIDQRIDEKIEFLVKLSDEKIFSVFLISSGTASYLKRKI